jgi:hypothetical protein
MTRSIIFSCFFSVCTCLHSQAVDFIPPTATPVFALEADSPFFSIADTFYVDSVATVMLDSNLWMPIYENNTNAQTGQSSSGFPRLIGYTREREDEILYKYVGTFPRNGVMYDYSLNAGDSTWIISWENNFTDSVLYVVDSVKYKNCIIGDSTKFMYVRALSNFPDQVFHAHVTTWVEGIGDLYHPFLPTTCLNGTCEFCYESTKFFYGGEWIDVEELMCEYLVNTNSAPVELPAIKAFPNPVLSGGTLNIASGSYRIDEVRLISLADGREVLHRRFMPTFGREVSLPSVPPGVYLVRVRTVTGLEGIEKVVVR